MAETPTIKRYNAYYHGWCLAFGEHSASYGEERDISWLIGEHRIGLILSPGLRKRAQRELLGRHESIPELGLSDDSVRMNHYIHTFSDKSDRTHARQLKDLLLGSRDLHMFLSSHFCYSTRTRIITFATKKPLGIMYKEMQPLKLLVE